MKTEEITIRVGMEAAKAYRSASDEDRRKLDLLLSLKLTDVGRAGGSLKEVMSEISRKEQERGLTPDILESIFNKSSTMLWKRNGGKNGKAKICFLAR